MTTLIFIRHAQSEGNQLGICSGQSDVPLTEEGHRQAEIVAEYLHATYPITAVYTSDLCRTAQTAKPTADAFGLVSTADPRFREVCVGEWEGQQWSVIKEAFPSIYATWMNYEMARDIPRPTGSECYEEVVERVGAAISDVIKAHKGECIAVFAHGRMIRALAEYWRGFDKNLDEEITRRNLKGVHGCSLTVAEYDDEGNFLKVPVCAYRKFLLDATGIVAPE